MYSIRMSTSETANIVQARADLLRLPEHQHEAQAPGTR